MQIPDWQQPSSGRLEIKTTYKSGRKGWVWRKKGDTSLSYHDPLVHERPPHRVGLAKQLQALALMNRGDAAESSSP